MAQSTVVPWSTQGGISIVRNPIGNGDTRIYYQLNSGALAQLIVSGPFDVGQASPRAPEIIAPAAEVLSGTPIAATVLGPGSWQEESICFGSTLGMTSINQQIHVFFLSRDLILSHYYWAHGGWHGGPSCSGSLTRLGIKVLPCIHTLSATTDPVNNIVSVVYVDANNNGTLSEAVRRNGRWIVSRLKSFSVVRLVEEGSRHARLSAYAA